MYTVYHLPMLKKVGCTNDFNRRMKEQDIPKPWEQYRKFVGTIEEASFVEEELRKYYKYKEDSNMTYLEKFKKSKSSSEIHKLWTESEFVGWNELPKGASKDDLKASLELYDNITLQTSSGIFEFTRDDIPALVKKAKKSQHRDFYWATTNLQAIKNESNKTVENGPCAHANSIPEFQQIRDWADARGIYAKGDAKTQLIKLLEEQGELAKAILKDDQPEVIDALGDILVVLINLSELAGYKLEDCLASAYEVISKRKGKMVNGTFVKQESL